MLLLRHDYRSRLLHRKLFQACCQRNMETNSSSTKGIKLLQDNTLSHTHSDVINYLTDEGINIMPHQSYSPELAP
jgi:hypothetical protein